MAVEVELRPWCEDDLALLRRINTPRVKAYLGGPETDERVLTRHHTYLGFAAAGRGQMYAIVLPAERVAVGTIGFWHRARQVNGVVLGHGPAYETGWSVLPEYQGRGIAGAAAHRVVDRARAAGEHRYLHAYPAVGNPASNAICRRVGFTLRGETAFEFPPGHLMRCNDWRLDLRGDYSRPAAT
jgi:RimJ/RimL family protein N-acetyltransferase